MSNFRDINFKYTDAEEEKLYSPELIDKAYVDTNGILEEIAKPDKFIVIGPKGAGKTALSSKLSLIDEWNLFVDGDILEQFEFQLLRKTGGEKGSSIGGALTAWQLILFLRVIPLFLKDTIFADSNPNIVELKNSLDKYGLTKSDNLIHIVQYTSRRGIFGKIKSAISEVSGEQVEEDNFKIKDPASLLEALKTEFDKITPTESSYYLVLDGLDYIIRDGRNNCPYISDLINAVRQLNIYFYRNNINAKSIILIRNEVLQLVPDPNLTKRVNDNGVQLRWYDNVRSPLDSSLLEIVEKRAHVAGFSGTARQLWEEWFPERINKSDSLDFVLVNTRFLPRDLVSFFRELQKIGKSPPFNRIDVLSALNNYSDWFLQELSDALVGLIDEDLRTDMSDIITELGREFTLEQFQAKLIEYGYEKGKYSAEQLAKDLFNASWVGNKWDTDRGTPRYSWKHRKINAKINLKHNIVVHSGLWKTLNLI
tara:strand:+ start:131 stop:1573 length:1443 start_codon:yes stop_codon:yes gene_type:complete